MSMDMEQRLLTETGLAGEVAALIEEPLADLGFRLVRVALTGATNQTLQIMAERPDGTMTVDDCETISRQMSPLLDVHDPIKGAYRLEVSSPGIDRPLVRISDFETWSGHKAKIALKVPVEGRRRLSGLLEGVQDGEIRIDVDLGAQGRHVLGLSPDLVEDARLVLTDSLIRESLARAKASGRDDVGHGAEPPGDAELQPKGWKN